MPLFSSSPSSIQLLIPSAVLSMKEVYLRGVLSKSAIDHSVIVYFTAFSTDIKDVTLKDTLKENYIYGFYSDVKLKSNALDGKYLNYLHFHHNINDGVKKIKLDNSVFEYLRISNVLIFYDYNAVSRSENLTISNSYNETFSTLHNLIQKDHKCDGNHVNNICTSVINKPTWITTTMFGQHILNYLDLINWAISCFKHERKMSVRLGNMLLAILADILLGYLVLEVFAQNKGYLQCNLMGLLEVLVNYLDNMLKWIMGAPAGLKLNNAFNKMLGHYLSHHIQLWWLFLDVSGEKLDVILNIYHYLGYLGFTFQAAMVSDLICIASFHSYCIYIYAARLFNIQITGLIALLRLFVGRKYNPLRGGIDSCKYTNLELFVGTVAFTILIFLLPTTTVYYMAFTLLRLLSLVVQYFLVRIVYWIQTLPLYVTFLWMTKSSKVAGNVSIEVVRDEEKQPLILKLKISTKSFSYLLKNCKPPVKPQKPVEWITILSNLLRGKQINI